MGMTEKARKYIFCLCVLISFIAVFFYNVLTPLLSDDLLFDSMNLNSFLDILRNEYRNYMNWNGRSVVQIIMNCWLSVPKWAFNVGNSICFVYLMLLMYWNIDGRKKFDYVLFTLLNVLVWIFGVAFGQTVLWLSGACNYLWGIAIILSNITIYRYKLAQQERIRYPRLLAVGMFCIGALAGWCNENTSGGGLLLIIYLFAVNFYQQRKMKPWMVTDIIGVITGFLFMVLAPGNDARAAGMLEEQAGIMRYISRFLKINNAIYTYFFVMMVIMVVVLVYLYLNGMKLLEMRWSLVLCGVCIATSYALLLAPTPMDRAYFGAGIFMTIACVQAIAYIPDKDVILGTLKYAGTLGMLIYMFFSYCENGADLARILREVNERDAYVVEQMAQGKTELVVPMIRTQFDTKYTFIFTNNNDVTEDPSEWGNQLYKIYYGLDSVVGVPREEWTEY